MNQDRSVTAVQVMPQVITHMARDSPSQDVEYGNPPETKAVSTNLLPSEKIVKEFVGKNHWLCCIEVGGNQLTLTSERAIIKHWTQACCGLIESGMQEESFSYSDIAHVACTSGSPPEGIGQPGGGMFMLPIPNVIPKGLIYLFVGLILFMWNPTNSKYYGGDFYISIHFGREYGIYISIFWIVGLYLIMIGASRTFFGGGADGGAGGAEGGGGGLCCCRQKHSLRIDFSQNVPVKSWIGGGLGAALCKSSHTRRILDLSKKDVQEALSLVSTIHERACDANQVARVPQQNTDYDFPSTATSSVEVVKVFTGTTTSCCIEVGGNSLTLTKDRAVVKYWTKCCCGLIESSVQMDSFSYSDVSHVKLSRGRSLKLLVIGILLFLLGIILIVSKIEVGVGVIGMIIGVLCILIFFSGNGCAFVTIDFSQKRPVTTWLQDAEEGSGLLTCCCCNLLTLFTFSPQCAYTTRELELSMEDALEVSSMLYSMRKRRKLQ